jgi:hypothetical protein
MTSLLFNRMNALLIVVLALGMAPARAQTNIAAPATAPSGGAITPVTKASNAKPTTPLAKSEEFSTVAAATAHCPGSIVVWSSLNKSHSFHVSTSRYFGKTKHGAYVCESDALAAGFHQAKS